MSTARDKSSRVTRIAGRFTSGQPIERRNRGEVMLPARLLDNGDEVYRVEEEVSWLHLHRGDLLIVEPRPNGNAASGEVVLAESAGRVYIGRWWAKRGRRALCDDTWTAILETRRMRIIAAVTMIVQP